MQQLEGGLLYTVVRSSRWVCPGSAMEAMLLRRRQGHYHDLADSVWLPDVAVKALKELLSYYVSKQFVLIIFQSEYPWANTNGYRARVPFSEAHFSARFFRLQELFARNGRRTAT
jgi:hypothetical protein